MLLQLLDGNLVPVIGLLVAVRSELLFQGADLLVPLVPEFLRLPDLLVEGVALLSALSGLVDELPDLAVEGVPLGLPLFGLGVELIALLPVHVCLFVEALAVRFRSRGLLGNRLLLRFAGGFCRYLSYHDFLLLHLRILLLLCFLRKTFHKSTLKHSTRP